MDGCGGYRADYCRGNATGSVYAEQRRAGVHTNPPPARRCNCAGSTAAMRPASRFIATERRFILPAAPCRYDVLQQRRLTPGQTYSYYILAKNSAGSRQNDQCRADAECASSSTGQLQSVERRAGLGHQPAACSGGATALDEQQQCDQLRGLSQRNEDLSCQRHLYRYDVLQQRRADLGPDLQLLHPRQELGRIEAKQHDQCRADAECSLPLTAQTITFAAQTSPRTFVSGSTFAISPVGTASSDLS